jgi:hypothetical protein
VRWERCDPVDEALIVELLNERYLGWLARDALLADAQAFLEEHGYRMVGPRLDHNGRWLTCGRIERQVTA